jgi:hypothetical protein
MRAASVAVRLEAAPGVDLMGGTPSAALGDFIGADCQVQFDQTTVPLSEFTGALDRSPAIVGGLRPRLRITMPLRGFGTMDSPPEFGKLLVCCTMQEVSTASPVPASPLTLTAGTINSGTLGATFSNTAQIYRGMPILLGATTGDQPPITAITDYSAGRVATFLHSVAAPFTVTQTAQIPINYLYRVTSDEGVFKTCTIYLYADGMRWRFTGCQGTWSLELTTGGIGQLSFDLTGNLVDYTTVALPLGWNTINRPSPPRFVAGVSRLDGVPARVRSLSVQAGVVTVLPENPEALEGYDPAVPVERNVAGTIDPLMDTLLSVNRFNSFRQGRKMNLGAILGTTPGNRFVVLMSAIRATAFNPTDRGGLGVDSIGFQADGPDAAVFLAAF